MVTSLSPSAARDRKLLASGVSGIATRVVALLAGGVSVAVIARSLDQQSFGVVGTLTALIVYVNFADLGIGSAVMTHIAGLQGDGRERELRSIVQQSFRRLAIIGVAIALASTILVLALPLHRLLGASGVPSADLQRAILALTLSVAIGVPASLGSRVQVGLQEGSRDNVWFLGAALGSLGAVAVAAWSDASVWVYVLAIAGTRTAMATLQTAVVFRRLGVGLARLDVDQVAGPERRDIARLGRLFFVLQGAVVIAYQSDVVVVSSVRGAATAAVFVVGLRLFTPVGNVVAGASQQLWTASAEALSRGDVAWVRSRFFRSLLVFTSLAGGACLALILLGEPLVRWWVGPEFVPSTSFLWLLAVWTVYSVAMGQVGYLLNAAAIVRPQMIMASVMTALNLALSIWFTHRWGLVGPLLGSLVAHVVTTAGPAIHLAAKLLNSQPAAAEVDNGVRP